MGTLVTIHVVRPNADDAIERAFGWFREIESRCSRFDQQSELAQLTMHVGEPVTASPILFEAVRFALYVAEETGGAFDPTVGHRMEARGFNREDRTGHTVRTPSRRKPMSAIAMSSLMSNARRSVCSGRCCWILARS